MIAEYWSPEPMDFYTYKTQARKPLRISHISLGLGDSDIVTSIMMWNFLSVTSRLPFLWEHSKGSKMDMPAAFAHMNEAKMDMFLEVGGRQISSLLLGSLETFRGVFETNPISHLNICKFHEGESNLRFVIRSRCLAKRIKLGLPITREDEAILEIARRKI